MRAKKPANRFSKKKDVFKYVFLALLLAGTVALYMFTQAREDSYTYPGPGWHGEAVGTYDNVTQWEII